MVTARMLLLLLLLLSSSLHLTLAHIPSSECCYSYSKKAVRGIQSYFQTPRECFLPALVVTNARGVMFCVNPKDQWVKKALKELESKTNTPAAHPSTPLSSPVSTAAPSTGTKQPLSHGTDAHRGH
ncbi:C-C motif chemokine 17-like [Colius striatus]|uniref:C-C motif chemokine 17-like n=1 Tax=Colius striatus TaxID=57412 RepID=UPI002B1D5085|nr:C-C motif chemokine 17-like [Colius striatus]